MSDWVTWVGLLTLVALCVLSTFNISLRLPSHSRLAEQFAKSNRSPDLERFVSARGQYVLATAVLRLLATLAIPLICLHYIPTGGGPFTVQDVFLAGLISFAITLLAAVAIPNAWAKYCGENLLVRSLVLLKAIRLVCYPILVLLKLVDPVVRRLAGVPLQDAKSYADQVEREILDAVSEGERQGAFDEEEKEMIESVIELSDTRVEEIMTPRTEIVALAKDSDRSAVLEMIRVKGHSRIPVFEDTIDKILGVLYAKDLLQYQSGDKFDLTGIMRPAQYIPESKLVRDLLREFREQKVHIAVVLDEYGGTAGLVTIEDILEELVGEIVDEYDPNAPVELRRIDDHTVEVDGRMRIDDLNDELDIELPEDGDYETIGGFVFSRLGKIPTAGERCEHKNIGIDVVAAEPRRITRVRLILPQTTDKLHPAEDG